MHYKEGEVRRCLDHREAAGNEFRKDLPKWLERKDMWKEKRKGDEKRRLDLSFRILRS